MSSRKSAILLSFSIIALALSACAGVTVQVPEQISSLPKLLDQLPGVTVSLGEEQAASVQNDAENQETPRQVSPASLADYQTDLINVYEQVNPSVVNIRVVQKAGANLFGGLLPEMPFDLPNIPGLPELPQQPDQPDQNQPQIPEFAQALGSGFVWDEDGHIVTNNHVVSGAEKIEVTFSDGTMLPAELVGRDPYSDLAVIKVDPGSVDLIPVQLANPAQVQVGQVAIAIGNPYGLKGSMTVGIVSALGRTIPASEGMISGPAYSIPNIIQTDAPINPGNSGGVLVDLAGQLIGIPTAIESSSGSNAGIGFAVPTSIVKNVVPVLIEKGEFTHPYLGISGLSLTPDLAAAMNLERSQRGALIGDVVPDGPADKAGLRGSEDPAEIDGQEVNVGGDVIVAIEGAPVTSMDDLIAYLSSDTQVGQEVALTILRDGKEIDIRVVLEARPSSTPETAAEQPAAPSEEARSGQTWLGIEGADLTTSIAEAMELDSGQRGVLVIDVQANSPADQAGLLGSSKTAAIDGQEVPVGGDVITTVNGEQVDTVASLRDALQQYKPGEEVTLSILRDGKSLDIPVTLGERPES
jgi:S1-C subfamily serine protease